MTAPVYGNYHGYYTKRQARNDPRLESLPISFFRGQTILDIGCNEGVVTCEVAQQGAKKVTGVDIDGDLIRAAWNRRRKAWSLQHPSKRTTSAKSVNSISLADESKIRRKRTRHEGEDGGSSPLTQPNYFPASLVHSFGPLPIPDADPKVPTLFPHNIGFRNANWLTNGIHEDKEGYDIVLALSITKWIHLNEGDEGLRSFFRRIHSVLKEGGKLVLEPQPWEGYSKASRTSAKLKKNFGKLQLKPEDFPRILRELGFEEQQDLGTVGEGGFRRPIQIYRKLS